MDIRKLFLFVETPPFTTRWRGLGLTDLHLSQLQWEIMESPQSGVVLSGTGGFRKTRFTVTESRRGKSGAFRVIYLPIPRLRSVVLGVVFAKSESANINPTDKKDLVKMAGIYELILDDFFQGAKS